ncbi:hypothetical protein AAD018_014740 [Aestuariibius insulae]|uniref:hypothetical protein n=1 Tax=Aestuariibius insulae TaxID=2058287 RepID=UPI00345F0325
MKLSYLAAAAVLVLAGCEGAEITQPPITVTPKNPSAAVGLDVYGRARAQGSPVPRFRGQESVQVRTRAQLEDGSNGELTGVPCTLDSGVYTASFTTPANIIVPDYGPDSPALFVRCVHGEKSNSVTMQPVNLTAQARSASAAGAGLVGAIVIGAVNEARRNNETDDFGYNPITVRLR